METLSILELEKHVAAASKYTTVEADDSLAPTERYLFFGTQDGQILCLCKKEKQAQRKPRLEDLGQRENKHTGGITVLKLIQSASSASLPSPDNNMNILASGSSDRSIRLWSIRDKILIQKLFGHDGTVSNICDGYNGSIISCSIDGSLKIWSQGKGRSILKYPFFECVFTHKYGMGNWLQALGVKCTGVWSIFVGDSEGGIDVWRSASSSIENINIASLHSNYIKVKSWSNVHRLRISSICVCQSEGTIATLSFDCHFKVLSASSGQLLFSNENPRNCMYTGMFYTSSSFTFCLVDELGVLELFSTFKECVVGSLQLAKVSQIQFAKIVQSHQNPALSFIMPYQGSNKFLSLDPSSGAICHYELKRDLQSKLFRGIHENPILHTSILPYWLSKERRLSSEVAAASSSTLTSAAGLNRNSAVICREESLMFSWDEEGFVCWDEVEIRAMYNVRKKVKFPISCAMMWWKMNIVVTGHDDGHVCLYNVDSGSKVVSKALSQSVSSLCLANNRRNEVLLGSDYDGNIAMWNLTLYKDDPFVLSCEMTMKGFHDPDDSGILDIVFHSATGMCYSCGNDATIQCWKLIDSQHYSPYVGYHTDSINRMVLEGNALLSSDVTGRIILWRVEESEEGILTPLVRWIPGEMDTFGVVVDMSLASLDPRLHSSQELDVYIARAEKSVSSQGKAFVHRIRVNRVINLERHEEKKHENEEHKYESKYGVGGPAIEPISVYPDEVGIESFCEILYPCISVDLIKTLNYDEGSIDGDGEPSSLNLVPIDSLKSAGEQKYIDKHHQDEHPYEHENVSSEIYTPAPSVLYLGRSNGSIYRFEI